MQSYQNMLLITDLDGTLLQTNQEISQENLHAIRNFVDEGGLFTVATGRSRLSVARYLEQLPINVPAILYNGSMIYDFADEKVIRNKYLDLSARKILQDVCLLFPGVGIEIYRDDEIYFVCENELTIMHQRREQLMPDTSQSLSAVPEGWNKVVIVHKPEIILQMQNYFSPYLKKFHHVQSEPQFLELLPEGVSKGTALLEVLTLIDLPTEQTIAIGDNLNDYEMLKLAGISAAVGNAHPKLKKIVDICCKRNDQHGVADLLAKVRRLK